MPADPVKRTVSQQLESFSAVSLPQDTFEPSDNGFPIDEGDLTIASGPSDFTQDLVDYMKSKARRHNNSKSGDNGSTVVRPTPIVGDNVTTHDIEKVQPQISHLTDNCSKMSDLNGCMTSQNLAYRAQIEQLVDTNHRLTTLVESFESSLERYRNMVEETERMKDLAERAMEKFANENEKLKGKVAELALENERIAGCSKEAQQNNDQLQQSIRSLFDLRSGMEDCVNNMPVIEPQNMGDHLEKKPGDAALHDSPAAESNTTSAERLEAEHQRHLHKLKIEHGIALGKLKAEHQAAMSKFKLETKTAVSDIESQHSASTRKLEAYIKKSQLEKEKKDKELDLANEKIELLSQQLKDTVSRTQFKELAEVAKRYRRQAKALQKPSAKIFPPTEDDQKEQKDEEQEADELRLAIRALEYERRSLYKEREDLLDLIDGMAKISNKISKRLMWEWGQKEVGPIGGGMGYRYRTIKEANNQAEKRQGNKPQGMAEATSKT